MGWQPPREGQLQPMEPFITIASGQVRLQRLHTHGHAVWFRRALVLSIHQQTCDVAIKCSAMTAARLFDLLAHDQHSRITWLIEAV